MGREVRRVPKDWEHPKSERTGNYQPMYDQDFETAMQEWLDGLKGWMGGGFAETMQKYPDLDYNINEPYRSYVEWGGNAPDPEYYRPKWLDEERTHLQMYEDTSEGTPISPVMETPEELAKWLADNNASAFGYMTATYEQWLSTINRGQPVGMVVSAAGIESGVAFESRQEP